MSDNKIDIKVYSETSSKVKFVAWLLGTIFTLSVCYLIAALTSKAVAGMVLSLTLPIPFEELSQQIFNVVIIGVFMAMCLVFVVIGMILRGFYDS